MFSLARTLFSPGSAEDRSSLFAWFTDNMVRSDSSRACAGSQTTQDQLLARDYRDTVMMPSSDQERVGVLNVLFFEAQ